PRMLLRRWFDKLTQGLVDHVLLDSRTRIILVIAVASRDDSITIGIIDCGLLGVNRGMHLVSANLIADVDDLNPSLLWIIIDFVADYPPVVSLFRIVERELFALQDMVSHVDDLV